MGSSLKFDEPLGGLFFWAKLTGLNPDGTPHKDSTLTGTSFAQKAIEHKVAFVPGAPFYADKADSKTLRLSFATADELKIKDGMNRLGQAILDT
jgi:DNA-binding transcriptional MocR family regulator